MKPIPDKAVLRQAGVIPWRMKGNTYQVLLITNTSRSRWIIPKGNIELFETPVAAAKKECFEEAGAIGEIHYRSIGHWIYKKRKGGWQAVEVYPLYVQHLLERYPERALRRRRWVDLKSARKFLRDERLHTILNDLPRHLAKSEFSFRATS